MVLVQVESPPPPLASSGASDEVPPSPPSAPSVPPSPPPFAEQATSAPATVSVIAAVRNGFRFTGSALPGSNCTGLHRPCVPRHDGDSGGFGVEPVECPVCRRR